jgi:hypothetical protein
MATASRLIPVKSGDRLIEVQAFPVAGTESAASCVGKAAEGVLVAFDRAQDAMVAAAKSSARPAASAADDANTKLAPTRAKRLRRWAWPTVNLPGQRGHHMQQVQREAR